MEQSIRDYDDTKLRGLGRSICEAIPSDQLPGWAGAILAAAQESQGAISVVTAVVEATAEPSRWRGCHDLFSDVREETLVAEKHDASAARVALLLLAENVAKLVFNSSDPARPFDDDVGEWISVCAVHVLRTVKDDSVAQKLEEALLNIPESS